MSSCGGTDPAPQPDTKTPTALNIGRENTIAEIPDITIPEGEVGATKTITLPTVNDKNNVRLTPTVVVNGTNVTASINADGNLVINYTTEGTDAITLTYTSAEKTLTGDTNNDGVLDNITETATTKVKTLAVNVIPPAPTTLSITRPNTIAELPAITINNGAVGTSQTFVLPEVKDKNDVLITPRVVVSGDKITAVLNDDGALVVNYVATGTGRITLVYTSAQRTLTEDTNNDGVDDTITETPTSKTKVLDVEVTATAQPLTVSRENTVDEIPEILIGGGAVGTSETITLPVVNDKNDVRITPTVAVSANKVTAVLNAEGNLVVSYTAAGSDTITLTYTSVQKTLTEDTNGDGVADNITETPTTKTKALPVTVTATAQALTISRENTVDEIPAITIPFGNVGQTKTVTLPTVNDKNDVRITPTVAVTGNNVRASINTDGNLAVEYVSVPPSTPAITQAKATVTEKAKLLVIAKRALALATTKKTAADVAYEAAQVAVNANQASQALRAKLLATSLTAENTELARTIANNKVTAAQTALTTAETALKELQGATNTLTLTYTSVQKTLTEDTNGDGIDDNVTETPTTKTKELAVKVTPVPTALTIPVENTFEIPDITILAKKSGITQTITLPEVVDMNGVKITPTLTATGTKVTASINAEGKLVIVNGATAGTDTITLSYTSAAAAAKTEDINEDGTDDTITETAVTKTKDIAVNILPAASLEVTRANTIKDIVFPFIEKDIAKTGTFLVPLARDSKNKLIVPTFFTTLPNYMKIIETEVVGEELRCKLYVNPETEIGFTVQTVLSYNSKAYEIQEDTNNDGVLDNIQLTAQQKTQTITFKKVAE